MLRNLTKYLDVEVPNLYGSTNTYLVELSKLGKDWVIAFEGAPIHNRFATLALARDYAIGYCKETAANGDEILAAQLKVKVTVS